MTETLKQIGKYRLTKYKGYYTVEREIDTSNPVAYLILGTKNKEEAEKKFDELTIR